jgi:hypothetical protein
MEDDKDCSMLYQEMERQILLFYSTKRGGGIYGLFIDELLARKNLSNIILPG